MTNATEAINMANIMIELEQRSQSEPSRAFLQRIIELLQEGRMTHILDTPLSIHPADTFKLANEVRPDQRKKMTRAQMTFVKRILPIYLQDENLVRSLPIVMQAHGFPSPYSVVFGEAQSWI